MSAFENESLPYGWKKEWDDNYKQFFFVDTRADPPRSIWVHPYADEQYLKEHPDVREKISSRRKSEYGSPASPPARDNQASHDGPSSTSASDIGSTSSDSAKRGFLSKIKDKAIGTKEEREARRRYDEEQMRRAQEARRMREQQRQQQYLNQQSRMQGGYYQQPYPQQGYQQYPQQYPQQGYAQTQQVPQQQRRSRMGGMGGMALPLIGGLAGGLLLGEALDGFDGGDGGDFGGGGFDGGDFGGGDFGGGDF